MPIRLIQAQWTIARRGSATIVDFNQAPQETLANVCLTKTRHGTFSSGAGGYAAIISVNGSDVGNVPAIAGNQVRQVTWGVVAEGEYAEAMLTVFQF
ncbi:MAG: hypothetical protein IT539_06505 [Bradyrhizobiaceae bacterium]|nr:hypothetical protein [Bradyrhizobiaceae bacterium]